MREGWEWGRAEGRDGAARVRRKAEAGNSR